MKNLFIQLTDVRGETIIFNKKYIVRVEPSVGSKDLCIWYETPGHNSYSSNFYVSISFDELMRLLNDD